MSGITVVLKGSTSTKRAQMAHILQEALKERGFEDVAIVHPATHSNDCEISSPVRELPVVITEG